jgi:hypothetical protein
VYLNPHPTLVELEKLYPENYETYQICGSNKSPIENWHVKHGLSKQLRYME